MSAILVVTILKATVILAVALVTVRLTTHASAAIRHVVLAAAFVGVLILLPARAILPDVPVRMPIGRPEFGSSVAVAEQVENQATAIWQGTVVTVVTREPASWISAESLVGVIWGTGLFITLLPLLAGIRELRRIRRDAVPWADGDVMLAGLGAEPRVRRRVAVLLHDDLAGPMTFGILRPAIVFPTDSQGWDFADLRRAMRHELEHVRRADCLVDAVARVACAIYWFHPLAWRTWHQLRLEAERACDDAVLRDDEAVPYAEQLVTLAARVSATQAPLMAMAGGRDLGRRITAVLDRAQRRGRAGGIWTTAVVVAGFSFGGSIAPLCAAWQKPSEPVSFEVASVKENTSGNPFAGGDRMDARLYPGGRMMARNYSLRDLILWAYRFEITRSQLTGVEAWMEQRRFDLDARAADGVIAPGELDQPRAELMDRMLQQLLADRFKLRVRHEQKMGDLHVLSIAPGGPRLQRSSQADACLQAEHPSGLTVAAIPTSGCHMFTRIGRAGITGPAVNSADIASSLRLYLGRPVVDRAQLTDLFDVSVHWAPDTPNRDTPSAPEPQPIEGDADLYTALREQLGLKLEIQRAPIDVLVIESAQVPTAN
jgi:uncharacterized protein (TIGR03435 family)